MNGYAHITGKRIFVQPDILSRSSIKLPEETGARKLDFQFDSEYSQEDSIQITIPNDYISESIPKDNSNPNEIWEIPVLILRSEAIKYITGEAFSSIAADFLLLYPMILKAFIIKFTTPITINWFSSEKTNRTGMKNTGLYGFIIMLITVPFILNGQNNSEIKFGKISMSDFKITAPAGDSSSGAVVIADIGKASLEGTQKSSFGVVYTHFVRVKIINKNGYDVADKKIILALIFGITDARPR